MESIMILYLEDWTRYPGAIIDNRTNNESFLKLAALLRAMGVRNHFFLLALHQPLLQGVDPFSDELTYLQKEAIVIECRYNPWYFFREVLRVGVGASASRFRANRGLVSMIWTYFNCIDYSMIMPRQRGKSVTADGLNIYQLLFGMRESEIFLFTKDISLRKKNIKRLKETISRLPRWLNPTNGDDLDNTEVVTCVAMGNLLKTGVGQAQVDRANNVGRGESLKLTQTDEGVVIPNVHISVPVLMSATTAAREQAQENGETFCNIFTSTAGKRDTPEGSFMYNLIHDGMYWNEILYDCNNAAETLAVVKNKCKTKRVIINGTFSHRQIGVTDAEHLERVALATGDRDQIDQDHYNRWTNGSMSSPLSTELNEVIAAGERDPVYIELTDDKYIIEWNIPRSEIVECMSKNHHLITLDSSNAVGRDANGLVFINIKDMSVTATCSVSEANLLIYGMWLHVLLLRFLQSTLVVENKSSGQALMDTVAALLLADGINPFKRIYNRVVDQHLTYAKEYKSLEQIHDIDGNIIYERLKGKMGIMTTGNSRAFLYDTVLLDAVKSTGHLIRDRGLSAEIRGLVIKKGRVDHPTGGHDDLCISWLMGHWMIKYSKNLSYYGINAVEWMSLVDSNGATITPEQLVKSKQLNVLAIQVEDLKGRLLGAPTIIETRRDEQLLKMRVAEMQDLGDTTVNLDAIMSAINENRVTARTMRASLNKFNKFRR